MGGRDATSTRDEYIQCIHITSRGANVIGFFSRRSALAWQQTPHNVIEFSKVNKTKKYLKSPVEKHIQRNTTQARTHFKTINMGTSKTINIQHKSVHNHHTGSRTTQQARRQRNRIFEGKQGKKYLKSSVEKSTQP